MKNWISDDVIKKAAIIPWWELALIKIFGVKVTSCDSGYCCVFYAWRGKMYFVSEFYCEPNDVSTEAKD